MAHSPGSEDDRQRRGHEQNSSQSKNGELLRHKARTQHDERVDEHRKPGPDPRQRRALGLQPAIALTYFSHSTATMTTDTMAADSASSGMAIVLGNGLS